VANSGKPTHEVNSTLGRSKLFNWLRLRPSSVPELFIFSWLWSIPVIFIAGVVVILIYTSQVPSGLRWSVFATAIAIGGAAFFAGGMAGFLFGIPRTVQGSAPSSGATQYQGNTNLEQEAYAKLSLKK
jgi:hypothetical protein